MSKLLIVGAGGHGQVVADTAHETCNWDKIAFIDDRYPMAPVLSWPVIGEINEAASFLKEYSHIIIAIGNNALRVKLMNNFEELGFEIPIIIHPTAFVSRYSELGKGTVVFANAVVNVKCQIGQGCIINTASTVDHDCMVGDGVHLSPGVHLAGEVCVGNYSWIGIGASVINQVTIGTDVVIGAGSVVLKDTDDGVTVVGVPGKVINKTIGVKII